MADAIEARATAPAPGGTAAALLTFGGLAAAFGAASCCALPLLFASLGLGTAWLGGIALLAAPQRGVLLAAAAVCLAGGAVLLWRQRVAAAACAAGTACARPAALRLTTAGLLLGSVLLVLGYAIA